MNKNLIYQIELANQMCAQTWENSKEVSAAIRVLDTTRKKVIESDPVTFAVVNNLCNTIIDDIINKDMKDSPRKDELRNYLISVAHNSNNDLLPYNYGTHSTTFLRTEKQVESFRENLVKEYHRIQRGAKKQKNDKDTRIAFAVAQLQTLGIDTELAIRKTAEMNGVSIEYVTNVIARAAGQNSDTENNISE